MTARNEVSLKIKEETKNRLLSLFSKDKKAYTEILKKMIVQAMIKLMEKDI